MKPRPDRPVRSWPLGIIAIPATVAIWSGWVGLGELTGFGPVNLLPGIGTGFVINTAITLPVGVEAYAAYALRAWLSGKVPDRARRFARTSAIGSLILGVAGQGAYHLMTAMGIRHAPWPVVVAVSALPVVVLGMAAALTHMLRATDTTTDIGADAESASAPMSTASGHEPGQATDTAADSEQPTSTAGDVPEQDHGMSADSDTEADMEPDTDTDPGQPKRAYRRPLSTGEQVARMRRRNSTITVTAMAERIGVTERTIRRHLPPPEGTAPVPTDVPPDVDPDRSAAQPDLVGAER